MTQVFYKKQVFVSVVFILVSIFLYTFLYRSLHQSLLSHAVYDSYTLQAQQWWKGKIALDHDYPYLELAFYKEKVWVSFPPLESVVEFLLIPFFGQNTPNNLVSTLYIVGSMFAIGTMFYRKTKNSWQAIFWGITVPLGSNVVALSVSGNVWFIAQTLSFFLSCCALYFIESENSRDWHIALLCWALSVAARPFQIVYGPVLLLVLVEHLRKKQQRTYQEMVRVVLPFFLFPLLIGGLIGGYNMVRFGNPFEYGHTYLPEHMRAPFGQFHPAYMKQNLQNALRLPINELHQLEFPRFEGFAFYIANPLFIVLALRLIHFIRQRKVDPILYVVVFLLLVHFCLTLMHLTFGEWEFGPRYLVDLVPFVAYVIYRIRTKISLVDASLLLFGVFLNMYGTLWLYLDWGK